MRSSLAIATATALIAPLRAEHSMPLRCEEHPLVMAEVAGGEE